VASALVLLADIGSKVWAVVALDPATTSRTTMVVVKDTLNFVLAYNRGGAWGLFHGAADTFRKPFFVIVSLLAIAFIVSLYRKVHANQWALKWGLPLVLGGALGNLTDRVTRVGVVDFIDYRADWVLAMNQLIGKFASGWSLTDHWPTFNVADIAICIGVGLMAIDVLFSKRHPSDVSHKHLAPAPADQGPIG
jgi:signal peptidase II